MAQHGIEAYAKQGKAAPATDILVKRDSLEAVSGMSDRLGSVFGLVQILESTGRFRWSFYREKLYTAFLDYFETISRRDGALYKPLRPNSSAYLNRVEILFRMLLRDGRFCFEERTWQAAFVDDGTLLFNSPNCPTVRLTKDDIAELYAAADTDILRREVLRPLVKDSLDRYNAVFGLFIPGEAQLAFSLLTGDSKAKQISVKKGRMRFEKLNALKRSTDAKVYNFPGAKVLVWGTAFEAVVGDSGSGELGVEEGMPVLANRNPLTPDAFGVTWQNGAIPLSAPPGDRPSMCLVVKFGMARSWSNCCRM